MSTKFIQTEAEVDLGEWSTDELIEEIQLRAKSGDKTALKFLTLPPRDEKPSSASICARLGAASPPLSAVIEAPGIGSRAVENARKAQVSDKSAKP